MQLKHNLPNNNPNDGFTWFGLQNFAEEPEQDPPQDSEQDPPQDPPPPQNPPTSPPPSADEKIEAAKKAEKAKEAKEAAKQAAIKRSTDAKYFIDNQYESVKTKLSETVVNMIEKHFEGSRSNYVEYEEWIKRTIVREFFYDMPKEVVAAQPVLSREVIEAVQSKSDYDVQRAFAVWQEIEGNKEAEEEKKRIAANNIMKELTDAQKRNMTDLQIRQHKAQYAEAAERAFWQEKRRGGK